MTSWLQRPADSDAVRAALREVRRRTGLALAFGGQLTDGALRLTQFDGTTTTALRDLRVDAGAGLGGRVLSSARPVVIEDYAAATSITHDYDRPVLAEGIRSVAAAPVVVAGQVRGILYAGARGAAGLGGRATVAVVDVARDLAAELLVRDEVDRRLEMVVVATTQAAPVLDPRVLEEIRDLQAELRQIAQSMPDEVARGRLRAASDRLAGLGSSGAPTGVSLSPRELDVLAQVALGCTNAQVGDRLSLSPETVKAYLHGATRKLGVGGRAEAVVAARRAGLLA